MDWCKRTWDDYDRSLSRIDDVPECLRFNKFIKTGYFHRSSMRLKRIGSYSNLKDADPTDNNHNDNHNHDHNHPHRHKHSEYDFDYIYGIFFTFHNETVNIYSHCLFSFYLFYLLYHEFTLHQSNNNENNDSSNDNTHLRWNIVYTLISLWITMVGSTYYHSFMGLCDINSQYNSCLNWDVIGVIIGMTGSCISFILHSSKCLWHHTIYFIISAYVASVIMVISSFVSVYKVYNQSSAKVRAKWLGMHATLRLLFGFMFLAPNAVYYGAFEASFWHILSFVLLMIGGYINVSRIPECWIYRNKDVHKQIKSVCGNIVHYIGNSHQLWHIITVGCCMCTYYGSIWDYRNWYEANHC